MKLLIVDTETSDTNTSICEISATLYQVTGKPGAIASVSTLIPVLENSLEPINNIPAELTQEANKIYLQSLSLFREMALIADYPVAFNAEFDSNILKEFLPDLLSGTWLCAMRDFDWGNYHTLNYHGGFKLTELALWMGIGISSIHRAGDDVRLLVECFNRRKNLLELVENAIVVANSPAIHIKALVSYENRKLASDARFIWDSDARMWHKQIKECRLDKFIESLNFEVEILEGQLF